MPANDNSIALFQTYVPLIDEVYKLGSTTAVFDGRNDLAQMTRNGKTFKVPKISMDGLGDYGRNGSGYPRGATKLEFEDKDPNFDRATKFGVEDQDNMETNGIAFGMLGGEFMRTKVVPEIDAFRYAQYGTAAGFKKTEALATPEAALAAIRAIMVEMDDAEVPLEGRHLRIRADLLDMINHLDLTKSNAVMSRFASIVTVPSSRFYSAITQWNGTTDEKFGYEKAAGALDCAFQVIHPAALIQYYKSVLTKVFTPQENQESDEWLLFFHAYGICETYDNKIYGLGAHYLPAEEEETVEENNGGENNGGDNNGGETNGQN